VLDVIFRSRSQFGLEVACIRSEVDCTRCHQGPPVGLCKAGLDTAYRDCESVTDDHYSGEIRVLIIQPSSAAHFRTGVGLNPDCIRVSARLILGSADAIDF
jgi:hypothetical protein